MFIHWETLNKTTSLFHTSSVVKSGQSKRTHTHSIFCWSNEHCFQDHHTFRMAYVPLLPSQSPETAWSLPLPIQVQEKTSSKHPAAVSCCCCFRQALERSVGKVEHLWP